MKAYTFISILISLLLLSCNTDNEPKWSKGEGLEIYMSTYTNSYSYNIDYSGIPLDTIELDNEPLLKYEQILQYDSNSHKITLSGSHGFLQELPTGVYGRMFVVTIDAERIYCGFNWSTYSSVPCHWVFIMEPDNTLNNLEENEFAISFPDVNLADPRLDERIVARLKKDGKLH